MYDPLLKHMLSIILFNCYDQYLIKVWSTLEIRKKFYYFNNVYIQY